MNEQEQKLMEQALEHMKKAEWNPTKWAEAIQNGYQGEPYNYEVTHNFHAQQLMWQAAHAAPTPPPPKSAMGQRCVYFSGVNQHAIDRLCALGPGYTALFSADLNLSVLGKPYYVSNVQINQVETAGIKVASWCDGDQTPVSAAQAMAADRALDFASAQFETNEQYRLMIESGVPLGIGEPSMLNDQNLEGAIQRVNAGKLALIGEVMRPDPTYSARGINIASACYYIDRDAKVGGYIPLSAYGVMPSAQRAICSVYTGGRMTDADWDLYETWTRP